MSWSTQSEEKSRGVMTIGNQKLAFAAAQRNCPKLPPVVEVRCPLDNKLRQVALNFQLDLSVGPPSERMDLHRMFLQKRELGIKTQMRSTAVSQVNFRRKESLWHAAREFAHSRNVVKGLS